MKLRNTYNLAFPVNVKRFYIVRIFLILTANLTFAAQQTINLTEMTRHYLGRHPLMGYKWAAPTVTGRHRHGDLIVE